MAGLCTELPIYCRPCLRLALQASKARSFTTTRSRQKHGSLPTFQPTSSPELDTLLSTFRTNIFLPSHLLKLQRNLIYKPRNHSLLTSNEPATVSVGNEVLQMHPLNHLTDEPNTRSSIAKVLDLMKEGRDWNNLPGFLEGLRTAKRKVRTWQVKKMVRRANVAGRQGTVMECLRRVEGTGVGLWELSVAREVMWGAVLRAGQAEWSKEGVEQALKFAEGVAELMEDPRHTLENAKGAGYADPRYMPEVVGVSVQLRAARAVLFGEGKDEGGRVKKGVEQLMACWGNKEMGFKEGDWNEANYQLMMWAPVWHGMNMAQKVLGKDSEIGLFLGTKVKRELEPLLRKARDVLVKKTPQDCGRRGLKMYDELSKVSF